MGEEPSQEIKADFALGLPDLRMDFGAPGDEECEDDAVTQPIAAPEATEECEEPITAAAQPEADECEEEGNEVAPELEMRIEPAAVVEDIKMYGEEHMIPEIEECEE